MRTGDYPSGNPKKNRQSAGTSPPMTSQPMTTTSQHTTFMTVEAFRSHWQGHRALTRRMIETFPEDQLFSFSIGGMRSFGELTKELLGIGVPTLRELTGGETVPFADAEGESREDLLRLWDQQTAVIDELLAQIPEPRFQETTTIFGQYTGEIWKLLMYAHDNEIHHRGQGYVYLRALGIEPPAFWDRP